MQTIPRQRLHPVDLYHMLDWIRDDWEGDEVQMAHQLDRLKWHLDELPETYRLAALDPYSTLCRARIISGQPWRQALVQLAGIVAAWGRERERLRART